MIRDLVRTTQVNSKSFPHNSPSPHPFFIFFLTTTKSVHHHHTMMSHPPTIAPSPTPTTAAAPLFPVHRRFSPPLPRRVAALPRRGRIACEVAAAAAAAAADEAATSPARIGARVRVKGGPLKVYHVPKVAEVDLGGREGVLKQHVVDWKGRKVSANLPFKVEFVLSGVEGRQGPLKFFAHLREDEFDYLD